MASSTRTAYVVLGVFVLVIAAAVGFGSLMTLGWLTPVAIAPGIGLGIMGLGVLIIAQAMPRKTDAGAIEAAPDQEIRDLAPLSPVDLAGWTETTADEVARRFGPVAIEGGHGRRHCLTVQPMRGQLSPDP